LNPCSLAATSANLLAVQLLLAVAAKPLLAADAVAKA
jgi:hypothetical protein